MMFGWGELVIVIVLAIILLGPDKLPEVARTLGKIYTEYKKAKRRLELEILYGYEMPTKEVKSMPENYLNRRGVKSVNIEGNNNVADRPK
jgi:TatA/E family protein of Tat protein translocase